MAVLLVVTPARADERGDALKKSARSFVEALTKEDFKTAAAANFDDTVKKLSPEDKLKEFWAELQKRIGKFEKIEGLYTEKAGKYDVVAVICTFGKAKFDFRVVFDADKRITGYSLLPSKGSYTFKPPAYAKADSYTETKVTVGAGGDWELPGTLTLPKGDGPFPAAVLVHGSGPHDQDETIGPNKPLRDLAWGLASQGVAVLRYQKRTHAHGPKMVKNKEALTVKEETIDDAVAAAALLRKHDKIDPKRIFIIGHSLGALVAPRIGTADKALAGLVMLAGNSRPLEDLIIEQFTYLYSLQGELGDKEKAHLTELKEQAARVKGEKLSKDTPAKELPLGLSAPYWLDLRAHDPPAIAAKLKQPLLILQGERDYQVTMADFAGWKKALQAKQNATLKSYPKLNHLFMVGEGKATPAEYMKAGHVDKQVIDDVGVWIKKR